MSRYPLNLPHDLKYEAEELARKQGVSLNQFILWAVAEKVGALGRQLDDPSFPHITYVRGASGVPKPILRGTSIHVQTIVIAAERWGMAPEDIAQNYDISLGDVREMLAFYTVHNIELDAAIASDEAREVAASHA